MRIVGVTYGVEGGSPFCQSFKETVRGKSGGAPLGLSASDEAMIPKQLIIDCDPGVDDAVALFLAFACRDALDIRAITTVAGNVAADLTARNARLIRQIAAREDVPIYAGCRAPMVRTPVEAGHFHGASGLGALTITEPVAPLADGHAVDFIVQTLMAAEPGVIDLAITGPCTNVAMAMVREPAIVTRLGDVVIMGGARREGGNITASAEYNIHADPHAAHVVVSSGARVVMLGLDVTHQIRATPDRIATIAAIDTPPARAVANLLTFSSDVERDLASGGGAPLHDPATIAWLLAPDLFRARPCVIEVETSSPLTLGHTAVEFRGAAASSTLWVTDADADGVFALLTARLAAL